MSSGEFQTLTSGRAIVNQILLVEDEPETASFLKELLQQQGYRVVVAKDGGQAHSAFSMHKPDFVILDLILPGEESGFEICERMKQAEENVPVLVLSAIELEDAHNLARRVGADDYLTKPFDPNELLERIVAVAERVWEKTHIKPRRSEERIRFQCRCGKRFKVSATHRGKSMTCPECGEPLTVPVQA